MRGSDCLYAKATDCVMKLNNIIIHFATLAHSCIFLLTCLITPFKALHAVLHVNIEICPMNNVEDIQVRFESYNMLAEHLSRVIAYQK